MDRPAHLTNIFDPVATLAQAILELSWPVLWICAGIFVIVVGLLTYILIWFRRRRADIEEPRPVYGILWHPTRQYASARHGAQA